MSVHSYVARFDHPPALIFGLLVDVARHNRVLPYCTKVTVVAQRQLADGAHEATVQHHMNIARIGLDSHVDSQLFHRPDQMSLEMVTRAAGQNEGGLKATGQVMASGSGSELRLTVDTGGLPLRYRILLLDAVLRRAVDKTVEKIGRRADEVAAK